jgi:hypothetical protein
MATSSSPLTDHRVRGRQDSQLRDKWFLLRSHISDLAPNVDGASGDSTVDNCIATGSSPADVSLAVNTICGRNPHVKSANCLKPLGSQISSDLHEELILRRCESAVARLVSVQSGVRDVAELNDLDDLVGCFELLGTGAEATAFDAVAKISRQRGHKEVRKTYQQLHFFLFCFVRL